MAIQALKYPLPDSFQGSLSIVQELEVELALLGVLDVNRDL
jgi:hypothetical protein